MKSDVKVLDKKSLNNEIVVVVGTRPGIVMLAPIIHELIKREVPYFVLHTGQHYSPNMDANFFADLHLPPPHFRIEGVSEFKTHGGQTSVMLKGIEDILIERRPKLVLVGGDANTNLAGALAARKLNIGLGHVEAGERSFDWRMPEEHNRRIIDHISDMLFVTNEKGALNLENESVQGEVHATGNTIVDACINHLEIAKQTSGMYEKLGLNEGQYILLTTHREENVDNKDNLVGALKGVSDFAATVDLPVIFLVHPRTDKRLQEFDLLDWASGLPNIRLSEAANYLDFLKLIAQARIVFTDSGGVQQESCIVGTPCVTLRENTEWTETLESGANRLSGCDPEKIVACGRQALDAPREWAIPFGDGDASKKIVEISLAYLGKSN